MSTQNEEFARFMREAAIRWPIEDQLNVLRVAAQGARDANAELAEVMRALPTEEPPCTP
jgi:hypothetical protein